MLSMQLIKHHPILSVCFLKDEDYEGYGKCARGFAASLGVYSVMLALAFNRSFEDEDDCHLCWTAVELKALVYFFEFFTGKKVYATLRFAHCAIIAEHLKLSALCSN